MADEKYEIRLVKIEGTSESVVDAQEVPMEKLQALPLPVLCNERVGANRRIRIYSKPSTLPAIC